MHGRRRSVVSIMVAGLVLPGCAEGVADEATPSVVSQPAASDVVTCSSPRVREPQLCRTVDVGGSTVRYTFAFERVQRRPSEPW